MRSVLTLLEPNYTPPDRHTISRRVAALYHTYVDELKLVLAKCGPLAFTCDLWTSGMRDTYMVLTVHTFNRLFQPVALVLGFHHFNCSHLGTNIKAYIKFELDRFGLEKKLFAGIVTDNGRDIKSATAAADFGLPYSCVAHTLNLVLKNSLCLWTPPNPKK